MLIFCYMLGLYAVQHNVGTIPFDSRRTRRPHSKDLYHREISRELHMHRTERKTAPPALPSSALQTQVRYLIDTIVKNVLTQPQSRDSIVNAFNLHNHNVNHFGLTHLRLNLFICTHRQKVY